MFRRALNVVLIGADDLEALEVTVDLARAVSGRVGIDAGGLRACRQLGSLASSRMGLLVGLN